MIFPHSAASHHHADHERVAAKQGIWTTIAGTRTLAIPVAQTIFSELGPEKRAEMGISDFMIRLSIGIEDIEDLLADFGGALEG